MKKLLVRYNGWGEHWHLGTLAHAGSTLLFEYSAEALRQQLELSEVRLPLRKEAYGDMPAHLDRLPGLIADSLPDGWGLLLMDREFRKRGLNSAMLSPLDRLAYIGNRGMGALVFEPAEDQALAPADLRLLDLARQVKTVLAGKGNAVLHRLALMGGSPHGARPKVLVHFNQESGEMGTNPVPGSTPWLVKFPGRNEHREVCAVEEVYAQIARACQLDMPVTRHFSLDRSLAAFGIERFDAHGQWRVPIHTLAGMLHADFRVPSVDYGTFLRTTRRVTRDAREVKAAYARAVFNVLFNNRDDHTKNTSFRLGEDRRWRLAPCYDLTFSEGPGGEHQMDVCGEGRAVTRANLLQLATTADLPAAWAADTIDRIVGNSELFTDMAPGLGIRKATVEHIATTIAANRRRLE